MKDVLRAKEGLECDSAIMPVRISRHGHDLKTGILAAKAESRGGGEIEGNHPRHSRMILFRSQLNSSQRRRNRQKRPSPQAAITAWR